MKKSADIFNKHLINKTFQTTTWLVTAFFIFSCAQNPRHDEKPLSTQAAARLQENFLMQEFLGVASGSHDREGMMKFFENHHSRFIPSGSYDEDQTHIDDYTLPNMESTAGMSAVYTGEKQELESFVVAVNPKKVELVSRLLEQAHYYYRAGDKGDFEDTWYHYLGFQPIDATQKLVVTVRQDVKGKNSYFMINYEIKKIVPKTNGQ